MSSIKKDTFSDEALLSSRFRDPERRLFFARAILFANRIELRGFSLSGMYRKLLLLKNIERVEWKVGQSRNANITLWMKNGDKKHLWINAAGLWKHMIDANVRNISRQLPS